MEGYHLPNAKKFNFLEKLKHTLFCDILVSFSIQILIIFMYLNFLFLPQSIYSCKVLIYISLSVKFFIHNGHLSKDVNEIFGEHSKSILVFLQNLFDTMWAKYKKVIFIMAHFI
jgi:hypothetical protein